MGSRPNLHKELESLLGTKNCYFQPPESVKLKFPCIIYRLNNADINHADDEVYLYTRHYTLTFITKDPDHKLIDDIPKSFKYCRLTNFFTSDNLNHYNYDLYY